MKTITVKLKERSYPIQIAEGALDEAGDLLRAVAGSSARRAVVVSNPTVSALYGPRLERRLRRAGFKVDCFLIGDGERFKSLKSVEALYGFLIERRVERSDVIVALGGGVVGDLAGFAAATYERGIRFAQIPTTLLAQIDSSVGGKTAVNHRLGKNLIGAFHQPSVVVIDPTTLRSLPGREFRAGLCEAIKYGVIRDRRLFFRISRNVDKLTELDAAELIHLIARSCQIKADVVSRDERESGLRKILNFGHTVGHALEAVTNYRRFLHGEAVGHGMRVAASIAERMGVLTTADRELIHAGVRTLGPLPTAETLALDDIISAMARDKKAEGGRVAFILPTAIGRVVVRSDVPLRIIRSALEDALVEHPL